MSTTLRPLAVALLLLVTVASLPVAAQSTTPLSGSPVSHVNGRLPLLFERNVGQTDKRVNFLSRGQGYTLFLTPMEAVMTLQQRPAAAHTGHGKAGKPTLASGVALHMKLLHANAGAEATGEEKQSGVVNYFFGKDSSKWCRNVSTFGKVRYHGVYPGVDLLYYGNHSHLEYDFVVEPHHDYRQIALQFKGANGVVVDKNGDLKLRLAGGGVIWKKPLTYQTDSTGRRHTVSSRYLLDRKTKAVRFIVGNYDHSTTLVLDPGLSYSTYLGGGTSDTPAGIAIDTQGNVIVAGNTSSINFPTTAGVFQTNANDIFVTKINSTGTSLIWSTFMGGSRPDMLNAMKIDASGNVYLVGKTVSSDFPVTSGAFQATFKGSYSDGSTGFNSSNAFVTKMSADGTSLLYSTYLGGTANVSYPGDNAIAIALDANGNAYVTGTTGSTDFPTTLGVYRRSIIGGFDVFVCKLNSQGTALVFSTYFGSRANDSVIGIAVDKNGNVYIAGQPGSSDFPVSFGAYQTNAQTIYASKMNAFGSNLVWSTYVGNGIINGIAIDDTNNVCLVGSTSDSNFPTTHGSYQTKIAGSGGSIYSDGFVTMINAAGTALVFSTFLGGIKNDSIQSVAVDSSRNIYILGSTSSTDFPTTANAFQSKNYTADINTATTSFVSELKADGSSLIYSTYLGGSTNDAGVTIALDANNVIYVAGRTSSSDFPVSPSAFQITNHQGVGFDGFNVYITKMPIGDYDFNGDGKPDLLWQNTSTGDIGVWYMNGASYLGGAAVSTVPTQWKIVATGDFNRDGKTDIVWQNTSTGDIYCWLMDNITPTSGTPISLGAPLTYKIRAAADFNGDSKPDLLVQDTATGNAYIWYMNGLIPPASPFLLSAGVPAQWQIVGAGDFNGDGKNDIVWQNTNTGDVAVWMMNGSTFTSIAYVAKGVPTQWKVVSVGDFNGDGKPDLVWQNTSTGDVAIWLMNGTTLQTGVTVATGVPTVWKVVGPR